MGKNGPTRAVHQGGPSTLWHSVNVTKRGGLANKKLPHILIYFAQSSAGRVVPYLVFFKRRVDIIRPSKHTAGQI